MENNEKILKSSKLKLIVMCLSTLLPILIVILLEGPSILDEMVIYKDLVVLRYAIFVLLEGYIGIKIYKYAKILTDVEYREMVILRKNDERISYIRLRTNALTIKILIYILGVSLIVVGFINAYIFYTILTVLVLLLVIYTVVYIYFSNKY